MPTLKTEHGFGHHRSTPHPRCALCAPAAAAPAGLMGTLTGTKPTRKRATKPPVEAPAPTPEPEAPVVPVRDDSLTREGWLIQAVEAMRPWFPEDHPVPDVRVSIGWPAGRGSSRYIGQCFYTTADKAPALFISPALDKVAAILETTLHEMVHAAVGAGHGHKGAFIRVAKSLGFLAPWRSTPASPELVERLVALADELGPFPHARVARGDGTRPAVQGTRMLKVECPGCGCVIRMTRKWLDEAGAPTCGCGEAMQEVV